MSDRGKESQNSISKTKKAVQVGLSGIFLANVGLGTAANFRTSESENLAPETTSYSQSVNLNKPAEVEVDGKIFRPFVDSDLRDAPEGPIKPVKIKTLSFQDLLDIKESTNAPVTVNTDQGEVNALRILEGVAADGTEYRGPQSPSFIRTETDPAVCTSADPTAAFKTVAEKNDLVKLDHQTRGVVDFKVRCATLSEALGDKVRNILVSFRDKFGKEAWFSAVVGRDKNHRAQQYSSAELVLIIEETIVQDGKATSKNITYRIDECFNKLRALIIPPQPPVKPHVVVENTPTPTPTPTETPAPTNTPTPTSTPTSTPTHLPTFTPSNTPSPTFTATNTQVPGLPTWTPAPTETQTQTPTVTTTSTTTVTPTTTQTVTVTPTQTETVTVTVTGTVPPTESPTPTVTGTIPPTRTATPTSVIFTATPTPTVTGTVPSTETATPTSVIFTPTPTSTFLPTLTPTPTASAVPPQSPTSGPTSTPRAEFTFTPTIPATVTPFPTSTTRPGSPTNTPRPTDTPTPRPTDTPRPSVTPFTPVVPQSPTSGPTSTPRAEFTTVPTVPATVTPFPTSTTRPATNTPVPAAPTNTPRPPAATATPVRPSSASERGGAVSYNYAIDFRSRGGV